MVKISKPWKIAGYDYYPTKAEAAATVRSSDDNVAFEGGLGWYIHSKSEYKRSYLKRVFGM